MGFQNKLFLLKFIKKYLYIKDSPFMIFLKGINNIKVNKKNENRLAKDIKNIIINKMHNIINYIYLKTIN